MNFKPPSSETRKLQTAVSDSSTLSQLETSVLYLCAIAYEELKEPAILKCLLLANVTDDQGDKMTHDALVRAISTLRHRGLLVGRNAVRCDHKQIETIMLEASGSPQFAGIVRAVKAVLPADNFMYNNLHRFLREIRLGIYQRDIPHFTRYYNFAQQMFPEQFLRYQLIDRVFNRPFRPEWLSTMTLDFQHWVLGYLVSECLIRLSPVKHFAEYLTRFLDRRTEVVCSNLRAILMDILILQGKWEEARGVASRDAESPEAMLQIAALDFLQGRNEQAISRFEATFKICYRMYGQSYPSRLALIFYLLALVKSDNPSRLRVIDKMIREASKRGHGYMDCFRIFEGYLRAQQNDLEAANKLVHIKSTETESDAILLLIHALVIRWLYPDKLSTLKSRLKQFHEAAATNGYDWLAFQYADLLSRIGSEVTLTQSESYREFVASSLCDIVTYEEPWKRSLKALASLRLVADGRTSGTEPRVVWFVDMENKQITAKEQRPAKTGWTKGRTLSLHRFDGLGPEWMSAQDRVIASLLDYQWYGRYGPLSAASFHKAILAMAGHPFLFLEHSPSVSLEILKGSPELIVERSGSEYEIRFSVPFKNDDVSIVKETPTRYRVMEITEAHRKIAKALGGQTLRVPEQAQKSLLEAVGNLSSTLTIHSAVGGSDESLPLVESDPRCYVHLLPRYAGFRLEIFVKPLGEKGPYYAPGAGGQNIISLVESKKVQTRRNLSQEQENLQTIIGRCPSLAAEMDGTNIWQFENPEECLQVLLELNVLRDIVPVEWPEGGKFSISNVLSFDQLKLNIQKENDWFALSGELKVDDSQILEMRYLLDLVESHKGRFIPIGNNQFLALTESFRKCLEDMSALAQRGRKDVRIHPLAALSLQDSLDEVKDLQTDHHWHEHLQKISEMKLLEPHVPSTLRAELRDYQVDGFRWLAQLAYWGVGACLADDMGLGKTLQTLAVILDRAPRGPALVVCPASVTFNWVQEASRFAPSLNVRFFSGKDRTDLLSNLKPFDLIVSSYTLMKNEAELLSGIHWTTIVMDEAQAIKNAFTRRAQTAAELQGDFKIITTGTPIENHLGELWSLFNFINPGLLGTLQKFNQKFALPIEKYKDAGARKRLKRLIQPFILRRLKSQVLDELPLKTEITLSVEMTMAEAAFYEAMRRRILENLAGLSGSPGEKHLKILAEIMKLRRACCHPRLVHRDSAQESSKLAILEEIVDELLENRHKALIFSQFVDFLQIIREFVEKKQIRYQYLDGSTPVKEREKRVAAFQAGEADLFLISLRAGGQGLNLTAADYVIHMDPWWNPAVEDQASDRAHRIGQQHPVTIYRLVARQSIEEKIVTLHREKRDLADSLLEGGEAGGKITADQLLALIREM